MLKPGGVLVFDTINRTFKSYIATIVLAQVRALSSDAQLTCTEYVVAALTSS